MNRWLRGAAVALVAVLSFVWYFGDPLRTTPGFFIDESSIAYNAWCIAQDGVDQHGERWPVYFRAFGEYKNPVYIYLLAALFRVTGPDPLAARGLSIALGFLAALVLSALVRGGAARAFVFLAAISTPWLFETSRLVFEVAAFPLAFAVALWCVSALARRPSGPWLAAAGGALALMTYTYTAGRLLGPLMAAGLLFVVPWRRALVSWGTYVALMIPALMNFHALTARLSEVGLAKGGALSGYFSSFSPWFLFVAGDANGRHHIGFGGMLLVTVGLAACVGVAATIRAAGRDSWSRYLLFVLLIAPLPGALAPEAPHALRLVALGVVIVLLAGAGVETLGALRKTTLRLGLATALFLALFAEGLAFRAMYDELGPLRLDEFDAAYPALLSAALRTGSPIGVGRGPYYIHAWWYGALRGIDRARLPLYTVGEEPSGTVMLGTAPSPCPACPTVARSGGFIAYKR